MQKFVSFVAVLFVACVGYVSGMDIIGTAELDVHKVKNEWIVSLKASADSEPIVRKVPVEELIANPTNGCQIDLGKFGKPSISQSPDGKISFFVGKMTMPVIDEPLLLFSKILCDGCNLNTFISKANHEKLENLRSAGKVSITVNNGVWTDYTYS